MNNDDFKHIGSYYGGYYIKKDLNLDQDSI